MVRVEPTAPPEYFMLSYLNDTQFREMYEYCKEEDDNEPSAEGTWIIRAFLHEFEERGIDPEPAAQEPAATNPEPGPAALVFNSLAEYKRWAASASQQERETYWNSLSDLDFARLAEDLDKEEED